METPDPGSKRRNSAERALRLLLRYVGSMALLALVAVVMPYEWMNATHRALGMGDLPSKPVVGYLARSASLFYALQGGLLWLISFDPARHLSVLRYLGVAFITFGVSMCVVDYLEGRPWFWKLAEGLAVIVFGSLMLWLCARLNAPK